MFKITVNQREIQTVCKFYVHVCASLCVCVYVCECELITVERMRHYALKLFHN